MAPCFRLLELLVLGGSHEFPPLFPAPYLLIFLVKHDGHMQYCTVEARLVGAGAKVKVGGAAVEAVKVFDVVSNDARYSVVCRG